MNLKNNWLWYLIVIGLLIALVLDFKRNENLTKEYNRLEDKNDSLHIENIRIHKTIDSFKSLIKDKENYTKNLEEKLKNHKNKRHEIPSIVSNYDERKLDSILSNYRHIKGN